MASTFERLPDREFSSLILNRQLANMPPAIADHNPAHANVIEISDDEDDDFHHNTAHPNVPAQPMPSPGTNPAVAFTVNVRTKPDISPNASRDTKRQKLGDAPEASGSRPQYPRARLEFANDDGFALAYPAFAEDAMLSDHYDFSIDANPDTAAHLFEETAASQPRQPPYFFDAKLNIRMYCGPGYEQFPLPVEHDQTFKDACDAFDSGDWGDFGETGREEKDQPLTTAQQDCFARILECFPEIQHEFVLDKIRCQHELIRFPDEEIEMHPDSAAIVDEILEMNGTWPKEVILKEAPRSEFEDQLGKPITWTRDHQKNSNYKKDAITLLASHFDHVPTHYINATVIAKGNMFDSYLQIEQVESDYHLGNRPYNRSKRPRVQLEKKYRTSDPQRDPPYYCSLVVELQAAKQQFLRQKLKSNQEQQAADAETANLEQYRLDGLLVECQCCFDEEVPMNRIVVCTAKDEHPFCYDCVRRLAENQIGMKRYEMQCMDGSKCSQNLENDGISKAVPTKTFDRLQFNQQQAEIKAANIEGLEQCPLCDFQAICDPPEAEINFSCQNPDCKKVTCRLCHEPSHSPKTCEEVKKDRGLSARHKIEEARTKAMIRTCPSCQSAIIKSDGCNKMRCTCGTVICYACKADLSKLRDGYEHFDRGMTAGKKCPLYDDRTLDRHVQEANEAEEKAIQEAKAEDGTIEENTLRIETGKGKAVDQQGQPNLVQAGPNRGMQDLGGLMFDARGDPDRGRFNQMLHQAAAAGGRRAHRDIEDMNGGYNRNIRWLEDLRQQLVIRPPPDFPGVEPPPGGRPVQPAGLGGFNAPLAFNMQNPPPNFGQAFGHPLNNGALGHGQVPGVPGEFVPLYDNLPNQNHDFTYPTGFGTFGQPPQPNDPNLINNRYMATAQRIHEARNQLEQRRRSQVQRRNTINEDTPLQAPNPGFLNMRNAQDRNAAWPLHIRNNGLNNGAQRPQDRAADGQRTSGVDVVMANAAQNNNNADKNYNEVFANYLRADEAFLRPRQVPAITHNRNQYQDATADLTQAPRLGDQNQNQNSTLRSALNKRNLEAATRTLRQATNQPQPSAFGAQNQIQNQDQHQNRTQGWVFDQTAAPPTWGRPPENQNQNQGNNNGNAGASGSGRPSRRPITPREGHQYGRGYAWRPT